MFTALADPLRRELLRQLVPGPARASDLAAAHRVSRPAVSRHLRVLRESGLVRATTRGRERHYALVVEPLDQLRALLAELDPPRRPPITTHDLDALDTEVRRTSRERRGGAADLVDPPIPRTTEEQIA